MENTTRIIDCVAFKDELHKKLYIESGARDFNEYINYVNSKFSSKENSSKNCNAKINEIFSGI